MAASQDQICYTVVVDTGVESPSPAELRAGLEKGSDQVKIETLKRIITGTINGNALPSLMMPIIQYILPSKNKHLKKLLHFYWEVCPKYDESGKLKQEMILVVNAIRNDLQHPNEYIRGSTLRFLQKIARDQELLEPLIPTIRACLEHRHAYVRKNAVFALLAIHSHPPNAHFIPDASELLTAFLGAETDASCKRNAFVFLAQVDRARAVDYMLSIANDGVEGLEESMQMAIVEVVRAECKGECVQRPRYIRLILTLLASASSSAVKYEAATTLTALTGSEAAVKAAASALISLVITESDNNVKLIVLDRLEALRAKHEGVLDGLIMDVLQILSHSTDIEVRRKALALVLALTSSRNVAEVVGVLKREVTRGGADGSPEYRQLLIQTIHICAIKFSEVAASVVHTLTDLLGDAANPSALDVVAFVREVAEKFPHLRGALTNHLLNALGEIKSGKVYRGVLWIVGEYAGDSEASASKEEARETILAAMRAVRKVIGEIPILASEQRLLDEATGAAEEASDENGEDKEKEKAAARERARPKVNADGTYATESAFSAGGAGAAARLEAVRGASKPPLRTLILGGDFFTASVLASALTKLVLRFADLARGAGSDAQQQCNVLRAEAMLIMTSIIRVGQSKFVTVQIDEDSGERIMNCVQTLGELSVERLLIEAGDDGAVAETSKDVHEAFLEDTKQAYGRMLGAQEKRAALKKAAESTKKVAVQVDDLLSFRQFSKKGGDEGIDYDEDLSKATGTADALAEDFMSNLSRITQLTGFSDPIYAEALVKMHGFDIMLDVLLVNQTPNTLQNLCIDFATLGDLKILERPSVFTIAPHGFQSIKATIKVSSTETGVIFGSILWEGPNMGESCVILSDIHVDIMDYIKPGYCNEAQFRSMWTEFEWENRVNVNSTIADPREYLQHVMKVTNMACLTPEGATSGDCDFLSANMYAKSLFGEDALANLSIERTAQGVTGHVRIRAKTQGIALSLGDRITMAQKEAKPLTV